MNKEEWNSLEEELRSVYSRGTDKREFHQETGDSCGLPFIIIKPHIYMFLPSPLYN